MSYFRQKWIDVSKRLVMINRPYSKIIILKVKCTNLFTSLINMYIDAVFENLTKINRLKQCCSHLKVHISLCTVKHFKKLVETVQHQRTRLSLCTWLISSLLYPDSFIGYMIHTDSTTLPVR